MTKEELKEVLRVSQGYLKSGAPKLSVLFNISIKAAKAAVREVNIELGKVSVPTPEKVSERDLFAEFLEWKKSNHPFKADPVVPASNEVSVPELQAQVGMHIMIGCNHVPFENKALHKGLLKLIQDYKHKIKGFHLLGDFLDMNSLSSHDKGKFTALPGLTLDKEYKAGNSLLDAFDKVLPVDCWKTYLYGNHEDRFFRWMGNMDNAKTPLVSPTVGLNLKNRGYLVKDSWTADSITIGTTLELFHGIYYNTHSAKKHLDVFRTSCMYVHTHRIQSHVEGSLGSFNIGAGADFNSSAFNYATRAMKSQWQNGFAIVDVDVEGKTYVTQIVCNDGKFFFAGNQY